MPASDPGLRRVAIHAGTAVVDLALPAGIPVATLIPSIVDIVDGRGAAQARRYQLFCPGAPALNASTTLADNGIHDGAVLVLTEASASPPAFRCDDVAEVVSETLDAAARPWPRLATGLTAATAAVTLTAVGALALIRNAFRVNAAGSAATVTALAGVFALLFAAIAHRTGRDAIAGLTLSVIATEFAAVAGFLAVPGHPGTPNVLLAATAAAVTSVLTMRVSSCGAVTLSAVSGVAMVIAAAALVGVITDAPLRAIGSASALLSLGLLGLAARLSIKFAGLPARLPSAPDRDLLDIRHLTAQAIRADGWLTSLLAAFALSATVGAITTVLAGEPRLCCIAFGTVTGALLLLRARSEDRTRKVVFVAGGVAITATTFGVVAVSVPEHGAWLAAVTATLAATAIFLGFVAPAISPSPVVRRGVEALECLGLVATVPLTCWICGLYGAVRGLNLA